MAVYPNEGEDLDKVSMHAYDRDVPFPVLKDFGQKLALLDRTVEVGMETGDDPGNLTPHQDRGDCREGPRGGHGGDDVAPPHILRAVLLFGLPPRTLHEEPRSGRDRTQNREQHEPAANPDRDRRLEV